jgi:transcriptional regulator with XRE-family HTH domain
MKMKAVMKAESEEVAAVEDAIEAEALAHVGAMLRKLRRQRGLTVESLAATAGISAGLISQLERGIGNPSFSTLFKLAYTLEVPLGAFLTDPADATNRKVVRKEERRRLELPGEALAYELLTPDLQRDLQVLLARIPPKFENAGQPFRHPGEECLHVLSGRIEIFVGADERYELAEGDSITYDSNTPHWYRNPADEWAELIGAVTPPSY